MRSPKLIKNTALKIPIKSHLNAAFSIPSIACFPSFTEMLYTGISNGMLKILKSENPAETYEVRAFVKTRTEAAASVFKTVMLKKSAGRCTEIP